MITKTSAVERQSHVSSDEKLTDFTCPYNLVSCESSLSIGPVKLIRRCCRIVEGSPVKPAKDHPPSICVEANDSHRLQQNVWLVQTPRTYEDALSDLVVITTQLKVRQMAVAATEIVGSQSHKAVTVFGFDRPKLLTDEVTFYSMRVSDKPVTSNFATTASSGTPWSPQLQLSDKNSSFWNG